MAEPQGRDPINGVVQDMAATGTFVGHEQLTLSEATVSHNVVTVSLHMPQVSVEDAQTIANDFLNRVKPVLAGSPYDSAGSHGMQIIVTPQGRDPINAVVQDMAATGTFVGHEQLTLSEATVSHNVVTVSLHMPQVSVEDAQTLANDFLNRVKPVLAGSPYDSAGSHGMQIIVTVVRDKTDADQWAGSTAKIVAVASADGSIE